MTEITLYGMKKEEIICVQIQIYVQIKIYKHKMKWKIIWNVYIEFF